MPSRNTLAALAAAAAATRAAAQSTTIDIFVPGNLPGLEGPGSVVEASPEITVVALGCSDGGDCPLTVHQGASTWSVSLSGTVIDCSLDVPDDVANCEWDTPQTSIVGELPQISDLFIPMEITAGLDNLPGGGGGSETAAPTSTSAGGSESSASETPAPPPSTPAEPTTALPPTTSSVVPTTTVAESLPGSEASAPVSLPVISSSSVGGPQNTTITTHVTQSCTTGCSGGDQPAPTGGDDAPAPTDGGGSETPAPSDQPAAAARATASAVVFGFALLAALAM